MLLHFPNKNCNMKKVSCIIFVALICQLTWSEEVKKVEEKQGERLGLLASTLGVPPVPGFSSENNPKGPAPGGGIALIGGNGAGTFQGNTNKGLQGENYETEPIPERPYTSDPAFQQGSNGPCQCVPVEHCNNGNGQGSNLPVIEDPGHGKDTGYGPPDDEIGTNPPKDGAGVIDIRIVNRPPGPGGVQCSSGQVFCCGNNYNPPTGGGGDYFPGGGYTGCGKRNILNVPGWNPEYGQAKFGAYPWMAVILGKGNNYIGAGALLNGYYVLTAAHKVQSWKPGTYMKVRLGEWNAKDDDEPYKNVEIDVEYVDVHPQFNPENLYNDVALIKLSKPIDINAFPHIRSACLPKNPGHYVGQRCWVAGFGKDAFGNGKHSYIMKEVDLPIVESNTCENLLRGTRLGKYFELNKHSFLCAGGEDGKDACTGDGGSPLMCERNGVWNVVGLVAWGIGCADYAVPGVYVNVQNFLPWIENKINGNLGY